MLIELIVTIVVAGLFLATAWQLTQTIVELAVGGSQRTIASNVAYANLRQYANGRPPTWFTCNDAAPNTPVVLKDSPAAIDRLPAPVVQYVSATAPYGCGGTASGMPVRVESYVTYGPSARRVTHVSYASY